MMRNRKKEIKEAGKKNERRRYSCWTPQRVAAKHTKIRHKPLTLGTSSTCWCCPLPETPPVLTSSFSSGAITSESSKLSTSSISSPSKSIVVTSGSLTLVFRDFFRLLLLLFKIEAGQFLYLSLLASFITRGSGSFRVNCNMATVVTAMMTRTVEHEFSSAHCWRISRIHDTSRQILIINLNSKAVAKIAHQM